MKKIERFEYLTKMKFDNREEERKELLRYFKRLESIDFEVIVKDLLDIKSLIEAGDFDEAEYKINEVAVEISLLKTESE